MDADGQKQVANELAIISTAILRIDGDRDHMNKSDLSVEQSVVIAKHLRSIARELGWNETEQ